jgi:hypothetical protein
MRIWLKEPVEIKALKKVRGTYGSKLPTIIHANMHFHALADSLSFLNQAVKPEEACLKTLKSIAKMVLQTYGARAVGYYNLQHVKSLLTDVSLALDLAETKQEFTELIRETLLYIDKLSWWVDAAIPWVDLDQLYQQIV